ncbi:hypothetical protein LEP1GSC058_3559 [Leptospira fainei serovar Hurstbridge str. BUT 6]|uniref:Uncharacterized protein n=1 Tax=Leptospira fainei serovar Hurstbridge str. BUT 6 TaxID=1193011 RepID=S3UUE9_9LEPT|nr:hypothetical protein LEP1GSC058_3559 [Leptospira fainei serovar Hurstbridge str. BUT 6]
MPISLSAEAPPLYMELELGIVIFCGYYQERERRTASQRFSQILEN